MARKYKNTVHKNPFREDRPKKHSTTLVVAIVALSLVAVILGAVFIHNYYGVVHLTTTSLGNNVYDKRHGITYELAPMCYQPVKLIEKNDPYALYGKTKFYKMNGIDPKTMISTSDDGIYDVYYSSDFDLPTLESFETTGALICDVDVIAVALGALTKDQALKLIDALSEGQRVPYPTDIDGDSVNYIYFVSEKYSYLYYYITYFKTTSGDRYLYDRSRGICVFIDQTLSDSLG